MISRSTKNIVAIILARKGSKGIPNKNIIDFCGKPLISWTIEQLKAARGISSVWVSSDGEEIREISRKRGAMVIERPAGISGDRSTSEEGWLHALDHIEKTAGRVDLVVAPQVTSVLREPSDVERGISDFEKCGCDSMFSCSALGDLYYWERSPAGGLHSVNYDYKNRTRRQDLGERYVENGSFYLFKPDILRRYNNRLGGRIGITEMERWKMFEIDTMDDICFCEALMRAFLLKEGKEASGFGTKEAER